MLDPTVSPSGADAVSQPAVAPVATQSQEASFSPLPLGAPAAFAAGIRAALHDLIALARPARPSQWIVVSGLAVVDLALLAAFVLYAHAEHYGIEGSFFYGKLRFSFVDGGYPELYGYAKQTLVALLLLWTHTLNRQSIYRALAFLFAVTMLDDSLALHETLGAYLASSTGLSIRLTELSAWALIGLIPLAAVAASYRHARPAARADAHAMLLAFVLLLFFAVGMDVVHGVASRYVSGFQTAFTLAEDGGELVTLTLVCAIAIGILRHARARNAATPAFTGGRPDRL